MAGDLRPKYAKQIVVATAEGCTAALAAADYIDQKKSVMGDVDFETISDEERLKN